MSTECSKWVDVLEQLKGGAKAWHVGDLQTSEAFTKSSNSNVAEEDFEEFAITKSGTAWKKPRNKTGMDLGNAKFQLRCATKCIWSVRWMSFGVEFPAVAVP